MMSDFLSGLIVEQKSNQIKKLRIYGVKDVFAEKFDSFIKFEKFKIRLSSVFISHHRAKPWTSIPSIFAQADASSLFVIVRSNIARA